MEFRVIGCIFEIDEYGDYSDELFDSPVFQTDKIVLIGAKLYKLLCIVPRVDNLFPKILLFLLDALLLHNYMKKNDS